MMFLYRNSMKSNKFKKKLEFINRPCIIIVNLDKHEASNKSEKSLFLKRLELYF